MGNILKKFNSHSEEKSYIEGGGVVPTNKIWLCADSNHLHYNNTDSYYKSIVRTKVYYTDSENNISNLSWDTVHVWPEVQSLTFSIAEAPVDEFEHQLTIVFDTPADITNFSLTAPSNLLWGNDINLANNLSASTRYEINIGSGSLIAIYTESTLNTE